MDYKLVVIAGEAKQKVIKIKPPTIIGRSRDADVPVGHALVSRRHCEITVDEDGTLIVEDLGSLNGTYHGEQRITEPVYLEPGDKLTVGSITFQAQYGDFKADTDPPPAKAKAKAPAEEEELPDFLANEEEAEADSDDGGFPDFEADAPKAQAEEPAPKKRRPPPPVMESTEEEEEAAEMLELPEEEIEEAIEEVEEIEEEGDFEVEAEANPDSGSNIPVGEDELEAAAGSDSADIEEEVEVAAGDSRTGDSGSGMSWLTGEEDEEGSSKSGDSGLDDFFKSL